MTPPGNKESKTRSLGRKSKLPAVGEKDEIKNQKFKYDRSDKSDVIILNDEDYEKIIEDYKEKMSM
jgi:hypothetical protein